MLSITTTPPTPDTPKPATTAVMAPTYLEQERHMHEQYIAGKVEPMNYEFCLCGNLLGGRMEVPPLYIFRSASLFKVQYWPLGYYSVEELDRMEHELLLGIVKEVGPNYYGQEDVNHPAYETGLFNGMVGALEVLKEIHRSRGEVVDAPVSFTLRPQSSHA